MENKKKIILIIAAFVLVVVIGFLAFSLLSKKNNLVNNVGENQSNAPEQVYNKAIENTLLTDSDLDGLTNAQEKELGTNPDNSDTDSDGLLDNSEILIHKTNPLKADTDGDGKGDGYEVRRNLDPLKK